VRQAAVGRSIAALWATLPPAGRIALAGVLASAVVAIALGIFIPLEIRQHLLVAESRGLEAAVAALEPSLPDLTGGRLSSEEIDKTDQLVDRALLDAGHVRAKLWSLDGEVLYSDAHSLIGRRFPDVRSELAEVAARGVQFEVTDLGQPENVLERGYERLIEFYIPVRTTAGETVGVFEIYEDVVLLEAALSGITTVTWLAIGSGLSVLLVFLLFLVATSVRSINRDRAAAEARASELAVLVGAADALASSLEPHEFFSRLEGEVRRALGLSVITIERTQPAAKGMFRHRLRDGTWLIAGRGAEPLGAGDERILRSVANSLDAALANATLYAEVRDAARTRRNLLRKVVEAHEDERRHLVGELHDSLASELIRVLYGIRGITARSALLIGDVREELAAIERLVADAEQHLRSFMNRIRPLALDEFGLSAALRDAVGRFGQETHVEIGMRVRGNPNIHPREAQLVILRAGEEALLNVRKHANATRVSVAVGADDRRLRLTVDDDGVGWRAATSPGEGRGLGLAYLQERVIGFGGAIRTERSRLGGARLVVEIPRSVA
jgi:signal transduction histidine kinase